MKRLLAAVAVIGACAAPAFAQDPAATLCGDYAKMDNAGQQEMLAALSSAAAGMDMKQMNQDDMSSMLNTQCAAHPDKLIMDVMKDAGKM